VSDFKAAEGEGILEPPKPVPLPTPLQAVDRGEMAGAYDTNGVVCQTHVGGQALIEGIMMRGKFNWAVAVRTPEGGIYLEEHDLVSGRDKNSWMYKPIIRGCTALVESLALGYKALEIAAQHAFDFSEEEEPADTGEGANRETSPARSSLAQGAEDLCPQSGQSVVDASEADIDSRAPHKNDNKTAKPDDNALPKPLLTVSMIIGLVLGIGIFIVLPALITNFIVGDYGERTLLWNIVDGILRVAIFIGYIWLISRMKDIKRMFAYHGAEHKTIHCYEHGLDLTVRNAQRFPTLHVRCGTAFMLMTMIIAILVFTIVPINALIDGLGLTNGVARLSVVILSRIILLPLIAGLSYEVTVKWAGARPHHPAVRVVLWPGLQMQRLTTNAPDDGMVECAIAAMEAVLARERLEASKAQAGSAPQEG